MNDNDNNSYLIEKLFDKAIDLKASDIHLKSNRETLLRVKHVIQKSGYSLGEEQVVWFLRKYSESSSEKITSLQSGVIKSLDASLSFKGRRFRLHVYKSINGINAALRLLADSIPLLDSLGLPSGVEKFSKASTGLILITGATGSGKTTTIAAIIDKINHERTESILTIEDPIEYVFNECKSVIEQREVGEHVESFNKATVDALREDPDIILIGEMRDLETIKNAITLSETGHLVFGTLHTKSVIDAVDRMVDIFPSEQQKQIRVQLASVLYGILHQTMISKSGLVSVLCELLINDNIISNYIKTGANANTIRDHMRSTSNNGNMHIAVNAYEHIIKGHFSKDDARRYLDKDDMVVLERRLESENRGGRNRI